MTQLKRSKIKDLLDGSLTGQEVLVKGWVRTKRESKNVIFVNLNDGSVIHNLQVVADPNNHSEDIIKNITTGACIGVVGELIESFGKGQRVELSAKDIQIIGEADAEKYPLQPKKHSLEFLREIAHLRPRTNTISAVYRVRHAMIYAIHKFFNDKGFLNIHTPIITASDAEGAGEMFRVTTLDLENIPKNENGEIDHNNDFFGRETNLTVS
ncbi:OB-fold nucleic acid binding domain-containing protein, partial [Bacteroidota bacterium]